MLVADWIRDCTDCLRGKAGHLSIETYLITGRPNYYRKKLEEENQGIKYFTYDEIMKFYK